MKLFNLAFIALVINLLTGCDGKSDLPKINVFNDVVHQNCNCKHDSKAVNFQNIKIAGDPSKLDGHYYYPINPNNILKFVGGIREEKGVVYFLPELDINIGEQRLFDFNAKARDSWNTRLNRSLDCSLTLLNSTFDETLQDSLSFYHIRINSVLNASHMRRLTYLEIGKHKGIIRCYYTGDSGYLKYEFYPNCKFSVLSFQESRDLDKQW